MTKRPGKHMLNVSAFLLVVLLETTGGEVGFYWSRWRQWSECSATCGLSAVRTRTRMCFIGNCPTDQPTRQEKKCFDEDCCARSDKGWSAWSQCSKDLGCSQQRGRVDCSTIDPVSCPCGYQSRRCTYYPDCCIEHFWEPWKEWGSCNPRCKRQRRRVCHTFGSGNCIRLCPGASFDDQRCTYGGCCETASWAAWGPWGACSVTCGQGSHSRRRGCQKANCTCLEGKPKRRLDGTRSADGARLAEGTSECAVGCCGNPLITGEVEWGAWAACSATCGRGLKSRTLTCGSQVLSSTAQCLKAACDQGGQVAKSIGPTPVMTVLIVVSAVAFCGLIALLIFITCKRNSARKQKENTSAYKDMTPFREDQAAGPLAQYPLLIVEAEESREVEVQSQRDNETSGLKSSSESYWRDEPTITDSEVDASDVSTF